MMELYRFLFIFLLWSCQPQLLASSFPYVNKGSFIRTSLLSLRVGQPPINDVRVPHSHNQHGQDNSIIVLYNGPSHEEPEEIIKGFQDTASTASFSPRAIVATFAVISLATVTLAAKMGVLSDSYTDDMIMQDIGSTILTTILAYAFVKLNMIAADKELVSPIVSRKLIHTFSAPLFMLFWPLFSPAGRFYAFIIPMINALRLYLASGKSEDADAVSLARAISRSGSREEALQGPFIYVCILAVLILLLWRDNPAGIVAMSTLAAGDGLADLVGRKFGKSSPWKIVPNKSIVGSLAFWIGSTLTATGLLWWMQYWDCLQLTMDMTGVLWTLAGISLVAAIVELIPIADDNYTVPLTSGLLAYFLLS